MIDLNTEKSFERSVENLLQINTAINMVVKSFNIKTDQPEKDIENFQENLEGFLKEKEELIKSLKILKEINPEEFAVLKTKYKENWEKIQEFESENIEIIKKDREKLSEESVLLKTQSRMISSYKSNNENDSIIFDNII